MPFRSLAAAALFAALPCAAQDVDLRAQVAAYIQPSNVDRAIQAASQLRAAGFEPVMESFMGGREGSPLSGRNIVATIGEGDREILLVAHYDAVELESGRLSLGVVDNAASVVAVIEAAKILRGKALNHRIRIILLDQEELGLIGARKWIEAHGLTNVAAVVNSDVAAYGDTMMHGLNNGPQSAEATRVVREVCAARAMNCVAYPVYPPSDDRAFSAAGAPVVSLGFQDHVGAHQMWLAFNGGETTGLAEGFVPRVFRLIHSAEDTMDHVDPATVKTAGEVYAAVVERLDARLAAR